MLCYVRVMILFYDSYHRNLIKFGKILPKNWLVADVIGIILKIMSTQQDVMRQQHKVGT